MSSDYARFQHLYLGSAYAGFTIDFYEAGTLTDKYVWVDRYKSTGVYRVSSDSNGMASWFADGIYRVRVLESDGTLLYDWDNVRHIEDVEIDSAILASNYASLNEAITDIGSTEADLLIVAQLPMTGNAIVPSTIRLVIARGGSINQSTYALTINSNIDAGNYKIFDGTGAVTFGVGSVKEVYSEWWASLTAAIVSLGTTETDLLISSQTTCTANTIVPSTIRLLFTQGGSVNQSTYTLTINGNIETGLHKIFYGTGVVTFGAGAVKEVYPEWWGAVGDGSTNDYTAGTNALNSMAAGQTLSFSAKNYVISTASQAWIILTDGITVQGTRGTNIIVNGAQAGFVIGNNDAADGITIGSNASIVTNGAFTSATTSWTGVDGTLASVAGGQSGNCLEITRTGATTQTAKQNLTTVAGKSYVVSVWVKDAAGVAFQLSVYDNDSTEIKTISRSASDANYFSEYFFEFKAASTTTTLRLVRNSSAAGTMLFDTVKVFPMTSNVTVRGFNFKNTSAQTGQYGIWATYANNIKIEDVSGGDISAIVAIGNDGTDTCTNVTIKDVWTTGDNNRTDFYFVGLYRVAGAIVDGLHLTHKGSAVQFLVHDSYDIHMSNIHTQQIKGFEFTRIGSSTLNGFSVDGGSNGLVGNYGTEGIGNIEMRGNLFSNGIIKNTTIGISAFGTGYLDAVTDTYFNIQTLGCTTDLELPAASPSSNRFIMNNFGNSTLIDTLALQKSNYWYYNFGINQGVRSKYDWANIGTLANSATPSVNGFDKFITGGTTTITDFTDEYVGKVIIIIAEHTLTITDGTNIFLAGSVNWTMNATDTLTLICKADLLWYELDRSDN